MERHPEALRPLSQPCTATVPIPNVSVLLPTGMDFCAAAHMDMDNYNYQRDYNVKYVALDITDLVDNKRGQRVINAIVASSAEEFRTKRGRRALILKADTFEKLLPQLNVTLQETFDGLQAMTLNDTPPPAIATVAS